MINKHVGTLLLLVAIIVTIWIYNNKIRSLEEKNVLLNNNLEAYQDEIAGLQDSIFSVRTTYELSLRELKKSKDATIKELLETKNRLGIKDKELKELRHFKVTAKLDTTINVITTDSCEFYAKIEYNPQTIFEIQLVRDSGKDTLYHNALIESSFSAISYQKTEWKESSFFKRLFLFRWGKYKYEKNELVSDNDIIDIKNFKIIKIVE